jgi:hypothetical protein
MAEARNRAEWGRTGALMTLVYKVISGKTVDFNPSTRASGTAAGGPTMSAAQFADILIGKGL